MCFRSSSQGAKPNLLFEAMKMKSRIVSLESSKFWLIKTLLSLIFVFAPLQDKTSGSSLGNISREKTLRLQNSESQQDWWQNLWKVLLSTAPWQTEISCRLNEKLCLAIAGQSMCLVVKIPVVTQLQCWRRKAGGGEVIWCDLSYDSTAVLISHCWLRLDQGKLFADSNYPD